MGVRIALRMIFAVALLLACRSSALAQEYVLGPEDVVQVTVARHPEMSTQATVLDDGTITIPRVGPVVVKGLTVSQAQAAVTRALTKILVAPEVTFGLVLQRPNRVYVIGEVGKPGSIDMRPGWRITHVLGEAGGTTVKPELAIVTLWRGNKAIPIDMVAIHVKHDQSANLEVEPGDVLDVQEAPVAKIYVNGQGVRTPGEFLITEGLGVLEALAKAGGPSPNAALRRATIIRAAKPGQPRQEIPVDLYDVLVKGAPAPDITLEAGDTLVIPENTARIAVFGLVRAPGYYPLPETDQFTVTQAIALAGGYDRRAKLDKIVVFRREPGAAVPTTIPVNVKNIKGITGKEGLMQDVPLRDGDIVFVPETSSPDFFGRVLPALTSLGGLFYYFPFFGNR